MAKEHDDKVKNAHGVPAKLAAVADNTLTMLNGMESDLNGGRSVADVFAEARKTVADSLASAKQHEQ